MALLNIKDMDEAYYPKPLLHAIGFVEVLESDGGKGTAKIAYEGRPEFTHSKGTTVQGGIITAWLDNGMAWAMTAKDAQAGLASLEIKVSFLARVGPGMHVVDARIVKWGRTVVFLESELRDSTGKLLATASSTGMRTVLG